jgi:hypothetical protein
MFSCLNKRVCCNKRYIVSILLFLFIQLAEYVAFANCQTSFIILFRLERIKEVINEFKPRSEFG